MLIKFGKGEINIPNWTLIVGALVVDNMYANRCKGRAYQKLIEGGKNVELNNEDEESQK